MLRSIYLLSFLLLQSLFAFAGNVKENVPSSFDLYVCIGQSNMAGRATLTPEVMDTLLGMIGGVAVIVLLSAIIIRCLYIGLNARNSEGLYICTGVAAMLAFQAFENIGMCIGLFPVTGITLPFFSYGGSSLVTNLLAVGLVLNVRYRYKKINF